MLTFEMGRLDEEAGSRQDRVTFGTVDLSSSSSPGDTWEKGASPVSRRSSDHSLRKAASTPIHYDESAVGNLINLEWIADLRSAQEKKRYEEQIKESQYVPMGCLSMDMTDCLREVVTNRQRGHRLPIKKQFIYCS